MPCPTKIEHDDLLCHGAAGCFRAGYRAHLSWQWIPALDGVIAKLDQGGSIADIGCRHGASTIAMAEAFPRARLHGYDDHGPSIDAARRRAAEAGVSDRVAFEVADARSYPVCGFDLVSLVDCLGDLGDPLGAARHAHEAVAANGTVMLVAPIAADPRRLGQILATAGFGQFRIAVQTPFNMVLEARP